MKSIISKNTQDQIKFNLNNAQQEFLRIDKRMRKNILIIGSLLLIVVTTGVIVMLASIYRLSEEFIVTKLAGHNVQQELQSNVDKI